jgi:hypothetical protein
LHRASSCNGFWEPSGWSSSARDDAYFLADQAGVLDGFAQQEEFPAPEHWRECVLVHDDEFSAVLACPYELGEFPRDLLTQEALAIQDIVRHGINGMAIL